MVKSKNRPDISIILPCRNEEKALPICLKQIKEVIKKNNLSAEIIVSDSSTDSSPDIAKREGVILVKHDKEGYGRAYLEGFKKAKGKYILMGDADCSYDFNEIPNFINQLEKGYDLVIGNRLEKMQKNAMTFSHRYIGNPALSFIQRLLFGTKIRDSQSGFRAIKKEALEKLNLQTTGMEFASEMIVKAIKHNLKIKEIPINYYPRVGESKLRTLSDGWKHLRFMFLYSPMFLFFVPGILFFLLGAITTLLFYFGSPEIIGIKLYYHPLFISAILLITGYQLIIFSVFAKTYSITHLNEKSKIMERIYKYATIERASIIGLIAIIGGIIIYLLILIKWIMSGLGSLNEIKNSIIALILITLGIQTIFSSFMLSILSIKEK